MKQLTHEIERVYRHEAGQVLATLIGWLGDFAQAEDALQDALVAALEHWPRDGVPRKPGAWLTTVARRKALDRLRRDKLLDGAAQFEQVAVATEDDLDTLDDIPDERLKLIYTCCHPALPLDAQVALTLHTLGGLTTAEVAYAFLVPLPTMAQRLTRAKRKIKEAGIPFDIPPAQRIAERLDAVLYVLYLIFTEGYNATQGDSLIRQELCDEAIRLARILSVLAGQQRDAIPAMQHAEVLGLLALMLLHNARRQARMDAQGELVLLDAQDRSRWDRAQIATGLALLDTALAMRHAGPYQTQAAISALHVQADRPEETDWQQIVVLYDVLLTFGHAPVVELNRAVAVGMAYGPAAGLRMLAPLTQEPSVQVYHPFYLARADLLRRAGRLAESRADYLRALDLCQNAVERHVILRRLGEIEGATSAG